MIKAKRQYGHFKFKYLSYSWLLSLCFLTWINHFSLQAQTDTLVLDQQTYEERFNQWYPLSEYIGWMEDSTGGFHPSQDKGDNIEWQKLQALETINNWDQNIWIKLLVKNPQSEKLGLALLFHNDLLKAFYQDRDGEWQEGLAGKNTPRSQWDSQLNTPKFDSPFTFQIFLEPNESKAIYVKVEAFDQNAVIRPFITNRSFFLENSVSTFKRTIATQSLFHGVLWVMFLFHLLTYFMYKDKAYLYYALYIVFLSFALVYLFEFDIFLPLAEYPQFWKIWANLSLYAFGIFYSLFLIHFLHEDGWKIKLKRLIRLFIYAQLGFAGITTLLLFLQPIINLPRLYINWLLLPIAIVGIAGLVYISIQYLRSDKGLARFVALNNFFIIGGLLVSTSIGYASMTFWSDSRLTQMWAIIFFELTIVLQLISFSLSLSYKGLETERERVKLRELDQFKSRFFANISHEFRTPLTLILGPIQYLMGKVNNSAEQMQLKMIERNGKRLLRLINQILDLSKLEAGKMVLENQAFDYIQTSRIIFESFKSAAKEKQIDLRFKSELVELMVYLDKEKIEQILINLLSNALKYTTEEGIIELQVTQKEGKKSKYFLTSIKDSGIGISENQIPHIFKRFYQADHQDFVTNQSSTGIGLALTKELVEIHGGEIEVTSQLNEGTTFSFLLPLPKSEELLEHSKSQEPPTSFLTTSDNSELIYPSSTNNSGLGEEKKEGLLVQIIEDNPEIRVYLKSCLQKDFRLIESVNGQEGVNMAIEHIPDLIITDVMMPLKDGYQVVRELKKNDTTSHIPIIILTGKSSRESRLTGLQTTADEYLTKPFDAQELLLRINNLLSNRQRWISRFKESLQTIDQVPEVPTREQAFINKAIEVVDENLSDENFSVEKMGKALLLDRTQLFRKLKAITGQSPSQFIRSIRLKHAHQLLRSRSATIGEIAFSVGFSSTTYFNRCFKEEYGLTPGEVMEKKA